MRCDILTIFPAAVQAYLDVGVLGQAVAKGLIAAQVHDLRRWAINAYGQVDDEPYGGGPGMVLMASVIVPAVRELLLDGAARVVLPDPRGRLFSDAVARELSAESRLLVVCGRYEGLDERAHVLLDADEISLGDFVLAGGELAALAILEAAARFLPGVVGDPGSVAADSFSTGLLDHPVYTRPREFAGLSVPDVLLSGNHASIATWRRQEAVRSTLRRRPDLVVASWSDLTPEGRTLALKLAREEGIDLRDMVERASDRRRRSV
jgi:tRNA (guanine37-N1)-methyltransferase